jgi:hypothetical protein
MRPLRQRVTTMGSPTSRKPCRIATPNGPSDVIAAPTTASVRTSPSYMWKVLALTPPARRAVPAAPPARATPAPSIS